MTEKFYVVEYSTFSQTLWYPKRYEETGVKEGTGFRWSGSTIHPGIPSGSILKPVRADKNFVLKKKRNAKTKKIREFEIFKPDGKTLETTNHNFKDYRTNTFRTQSCATHNLDWNEISRYLRPATEQEIAELKDKFLGEAMEILW